MGAGAPARMDRLCFQQRADLVERPGKVVIVPSVDRDVAGVRRVKTHDHPHRRRLAGAVRAEEPRHDAGPHLKAELVDGDLCRSAWSGLWLRSCQPRAVGSMDTQAPFGV